MNQFEIQSAIFQRLDDKLTVPVYDNVPQDTPYPYVTVGDDTSTDWSGDSWLGSDSTITIHAWSRFAGRSEVKGIMRQIYVALTRQELPMLGYHAVTVEHEFAQTMLDPDGVTRHGVMRFRVLSHEDNNEFLTTYPQAYAMSPVVDNTANKQWPEEE